MFEATMNYHRMGADSIWFLNICFLRFASSIKSFHKNLRFESSSDIDQENETEKAVILSTYGNQFA